MFIVAAFTRRLAAQTEGRKHRARGSSSAIALHPNPALLPVGPSWDTHGRL
jgi:hypothetical protein